jgi:hypothetical protein
MSIIRWRRSQAENTEHFLAEYSRSDHRIWHNFCPVAVASQTHLGTNGSKRSEWAAEVYTSKQAVAVSEMA